MSLTHDQKKFIKRNIQQKPTSEIAKDLSIPEDNINKYLKEKWGDEKYDRYLHGQINKSGGDESISTITVSLRQIFKENWGALLFLVILVFICYVNSLGNALVSDDIPGMQGLFKSSWWSTIFGSPLEMVSGMKYYFVLKVLGTQPAYFRLANILFHAGSTVLVYLISYISFRVEKKHLIAFIVATLFAAHPILLESITWITGGAYAQYSFFVLLTLLFYMKSNEKKKYYIFALVASLLALGSTNKAIVLPGILFAYELSQGRLKKTGISFFLFLSFMV